MPCWVLFRQGLDEVCDEQTERFDCRLDRGLRLEERVAGCFRGLVAGEEVTDTITDGRRRACGEDLVCAL